MASAYRCSGLATVLHHAFNTTGANGTTWEPNPVGHLGMVHGRSSEYVVHRGANEALHLLAILT